MATLAGSTVGFIGLGLMGRPMSLNLRRAGADLVIHNRSRGVVDELAGPGVRPASTPREMAEAAPTVIVMVSDTPAVEQVLLGEAGVLEGVREGVIGGVRERSLVIDMGTTAPGATRRFAERLAGAGAELLDAPVSGGQIGAEAGTLAVMAGGSASAFARALPLLRVLGENVTRVGDVGAGQVAKAANQIIVGLTIGAVAEALALARRAGVDPARVREALSGGFAGSRILELHGERMIEGRFAPGGKVRTQCKDLDQALELADEVGLELPATRLARTLYARLVGAGDGDLDHSALIRAIDPGDSP